MIGFGTLNFSCEIFFFATANPLVSSKVTTKLQLFFTNYAFAPQYDSFWLILLKTTEERLTLILNLKQYPVCSQHWVIKFNLSNETSM